MNKEFYSGNRSRLFSALPDNSLLVLFSGRALRKTMDSYYDFFADRNFVYLTGIDREKSVYLAYKQGSSIEEMLFIQDPKVDDGTGPSLSMREAASRSGLDKVLTVHEFDGIFHKLLRREKDLQLFLNLDRYSSDQQEDEAHLFAATIRKLYPHLRIGNAYHDICDLRLIKSPDEIENMKTAMEVTRMGIEAMMGLCRPGLHEYDLEAEFQHVLARNGLRHVAFPSIIATGDNCFYGHYSQPYGLIGEKDLVLADVGAIVDFCCVDISRMFPASGRFEGLGKDVYAAALETNKDVIKWLKPGISVKEVNDWGHLQAFGRMKSLGYKGELSDDRFYGGHHLGFDVHDVGSYKVPLTAGMVLTVDTGIYLRDWGIALRVEDDVLITNDGCINLSENIPSEIADIEALMESGKQKKSYSL